MTSTSLRHVAIDGAHAGVTQDTVTASVALDVTPSDGCVIDPAESARQLKQLVTRYVTEGAEMQINLCHSNARSLITACKAYARSVAGGKDAQDKAHVTMAAIRAAQAEIFVLLCDNSVQRFLRNQAPLLGMLKSLMDMETAEADKLKL